VVVFVCLYLVVFLGCLFLVDFCCEFLVLVFLCGCCDWVLGVLVFGFCLGGC